MNMAKGTAETLSEGEEEIGELIPRPKRASVLYRRGGGLWLANYDGKQNYRLRVAEGGIGPALWSPEGRSVYYLSYPEDAHKLHALREFVPDSNEDLSVANTSQFVAIGRNADATVFVGASGSKASPYVLLLVRAVRRELTLCEHRASDPAMVFQCSRRTASMFISAATGMANRRFIRSRWKNWSRKPKLHRKKVSFWPIESLQFGTDPIFRFP